MEENINLERLNEIQFLYFGEAYRYIKATSHKELKEKLALIDSSYIILRLLGSFTYHDLKEVIDSFFEEIVEFSLDGNPTQIVLARKIIYSIDRMVLIEKLNKIIQDVIDKKETIENSSYLFENAKNLLISLGFNNYFKNDNI